MSFIFVGLGNPGEEYEGTRHNAGRMILESFAKKNDFSPWEKDKKLNALATEGKIGKGKVKFILPETFMNKSGASIAPLVKSKKSALSLVVLHDDLDLPLGTMKISFNRVSGGHRGVESVIRAIKTEGFVRIRVGVSGKGAKGRAKKPTGDKKILDFIIGKFRPAEVLEFKKISKKIHQSLEVIASDGFQRAMGEFN